MKKLPVLNIKGEKVSDITLNENVFGITPNDTVLYDAIRLTRNAQRQSTASTKTRSEELVMLVKEVFVHHIGLVEELYLVQHHKRITN